MRKIILFLTLFLSAAYAGDVKQKKQAKEAAVQKIAELEQELKYWKEKAETYEKEIFKLKVKSNSENPLDSKNSEKKE